ncbi:hypothetical protein CTAYLR_007949 [Chrysophaeum taylorii]|uniref:Tyrosinase copper-binding domain-containing protein n=1 Tax=Chrysophaeum taylorii TaxID=2483200 RepID=A0AAD7UNL2_9STRA|nr:hypothetical protein CTAYLR_007949 [Chrysophaeum taylorii]
MPCGPRVRKAWTAWSKEEQELWIEAVNTVEKQGHYWTFVAMHLYNADFTHATSFLFSWHRLYIWEFENVIRAAAPEYACLTLPLWDWALASELYTNYNETWAATDQFLRDMGGAGVETELVLPHPQNANAVRVDEKVKERMNAYGGYAECDNSTVMNAVGSMPAPFDEFRDITQRCDYDVKIVECNCTFDALTPVRTRDMRGNSGIYNASRLTNEVLKWPQFVRFFEKFSYPHAKVHGAIYGTMGSHRSPADPLFWGHHAFVDFIWDLWMHRHDCGGVKYADVPPDKIEAMCPPNTIFNCVVCGNTVEADREFGSESGSYLGLYDPPFADGIDDPIPFYGLKTLWYHFDQRKLLTKPPGFSDQTWYGTWTTRDVYSLEAWGAYSYDYGTISLANPDLSSLFSTQTTTKTFRSTMMALLFFFAMFAAYALRRVCIEAIRRDMAKKKAAPRKPDEHTSLLLGS